MDALAERLGEGFLRVVEQIVPPAVRLEDHSVLIGQGLLLAFALAIIWSVSGLVGRR
jgi:hypothetical protein